MSRFLSRLLLSVGTVVLTFTAGPAHAAVDLSRSRILISPATPLESDVVTFTVVVSNTGDEMADAVHLEVEWPLMGFLVDVARVDGETFAPPTIDHNARTVAVSLPMPAGAERRLAIRVLAPRDSGGDTLSTALRVAHFKSGTNHYLSESVTIDTRIAQTGVVIGGVRFTPASLAVFGVLGFGAVLWAVLSSTTRQARHPSRHRGQPVAVAVQPLPRRVTDHMGAGAAAFALTLALGFWVMFAVMAWRDYRSLTAWPRTSCTVLGGRLSAQGTTKAPATVGSGPASATNTLYVPVLGLRYDVDGRETFSTGFDTGSRLGVGPSGGRLQELDALVIGATVPCWYNNDDPLDVVVINGFGGAYVFALIPLPVFVLGFARARQLLAG